MRLRDFSTDAALKLAASPHARLSFSQFGEDCILRALLQTLGRLDKPGFYVDLGAFHPEALSNTMMLRMLGWKGLNVDANADAVQLFRQMRPDDINVQAALSDEVKDIEFSVFNQSAVSTADPGLLAKHARTGQGKIVRVDRLTTCTLSHLLDTYLPPGQEIDFMSVDLEGFDLRALKSNNWDKYSPFLLAIEDHDLSFLQSLFPSPTFRLVSEYGYRLVAHTFVTSIYIRDQV